MASGDTKTEALLNILGNGGSYEGISGCGNTKTQDYIIDAIDRIEAVEEEVEELKNNPDVIDIVATYADLQAYDTSKLTDKDIIRVLTDETHDDASTYYRWSTSSQTFTYIGTSKQYDDFVGTDGTAAGSNGLVPAPAAADAGKFLNADGDWEDITGVTTLYVQNGALNNLPANLYKDKNLTTISDDAYVKAAIDNGNTIIVREVEPVGSEYIYYGVFPMSGFYYEDDYGAVSLSFTITDTYKNVFTCFGSRVEYKSSLVMPLYSGTGVNVNGPMTQGATTGMVYADPASRKKIKMGASATIVGGDSNVATSIGNRAKATGANSIAISGNKDYDATASGTTSLMIGRGTASGVGSVAIGMATATGMNSVCISGNNTSASNSYAVAINGAAGGLSSVAIGSESSATAMGAVAIGANSSAAARGVVAIGTTNTNLGYNISNYRLLTGLYDPQGAHDAATKGYVDSNVGLVTLSYGNSTWNDFLTAYNAGKIVYCRASSNADPSSGSQTRMAFMAYINNPATPTEVEFQYVRSVSSKTAAQQMDQVFVYKLTSAGGGTWSVETRDMTSKIVAGTNMTSTYSNGTLTLNATGGGSSITNFYVSGADIGINVQVYKDEDCTIAATGNDVAAAYRDGTTRIIATESNATADIVYINAANRPFIFSPMSYNEYYSLYVDSDGILANFDS